MKLIKSKAELLLQPKGLEGIYKQIELCGRTCYKSEDKITEGSAKPFVDRMIASNHLAMLEHGTVYLTKEVDYTSSDYLGLENKYESNKYTKVSYDGGTMYITTNLRVLVENGWLEDLKYLSNPTEFHEMRYSFKLTTSIGVTRELNRHRVHSVAEQSTRYCNYSKDKFNNELTFCQPHWIDDEELSLIGPYKRVIRKKDASPTEIWITSLLNAEEDYLKLINQGWQPQEAREVLPLCTASEIVHTAFASDWRYFFDLRLFGKTGAPHPNMLALAERAKKAAEEAGIWEEIMKYPSKFNNDEKSR